MSLSNGILSTPINYAEPYRCMGVAATADGYELTYICSNAHGKANRWNENKPVRVNTPNDLTDAQFDTNSHVGGDTYTMYGMQVDIPHNLLGNMWTQQGMITNIGQDVNGFLYKLAKGLLSSWIYLPPRLGVDWSRISDFVGYNHNSPNPMPVPRAGSYQMSTAGAVNINIDENKGTGAIGELTLGKLKVPSAISNQRPSLSTLYRGILFYNDSLTDVFFVTEDTPGKGHVALANNSRITMTDHAGIWHARSFFSSFRIELCNTAYSTAEYLLPSDGKVSDIILYAYGKPYTVEIPTAKFIDSIRSQVNIIARVTAYANVLNLTNIKIEYYGGFDWSVAKTFSNVTLQPGGNHMDFQYTGAGLGWKKVRFTATVNGKNESVESNIS